MGNAIGVLRTASTAIPSKGGAKDRVQGNDGVSNNGGAKDGGVVTSGRLAFKSELELAHEPPTSIMEVLLNALYAMEFHKHLAMTNVSENYEFFQAVSHFTHDASTNKNAISDEANKIYNLYVSDAAPLRVTLGETTRTQVKKAIDTGGVTKKTFDAANEEAVALMERDSLQGFLSSDLYSNLKRRIDAGELEALIQEDIETVREIMSRELIEFLGDPDLKKVLSSQVGIDWFRKHLVIEFSEEGLDLWKATHDMLAQDYTSTAGGGDESGANTALERETGVTPQAAATVEGERKGGEDAGAGEVGGSDIRKTGRDIYERFIKSGCGAECNLPGTVVRKVTAALGDQESSPEAIRKAFESVEVEIFKLLAYDPFLRFKRSGMYTKYCMKTQLKTQRSALFAVTADGGRDSCKDREAAVDEVSPPVDQPASTTKVASDEAVPPAADDQEARRQLDS